MCFPLLPHTSPAQLGVVHALCMSCHLSFFTQILTDICTLLAGRARLEDA